MKPFRHAQKAHLNIVKVPRLYATHRDFRSSFLQYDNPIDSVVDGIPDHETPGVGADQVRIAKYKRHESSSVSLTKGCVLS